MMYILEGVLSTQILTAQERHRDEQELCNNVASRPNSSGADDANRQTTTWNVFLEKRKKEFDLIAKYYGFCLQRQSDRNLPRTFSPWMFVPIKNKKVMRCLE